MDTGNAPPTWLELFNMATRHANKIGELEKEIFRIRAEGAREIDEYRFLLKEVFIFLMDSRNPRFEDFAVKKIRPKITPKTTTVEPRDPNLEGRN